MLATISMAMGLDVTRAFLTTLITSAAGVVGAGYAGRAIVAGLFKLLPGAGSLAGGLISGATAGALTTTMGYAYIHALKYMIENHMDMSPKNISTTFIDTLKRK